MRYTGPVRFRYSGDRVVAVKHAGQGRKLLGMLIDLMKPARLQQCQLVREIDGIHYKVSSIFGDRVVEIFAPPVAGSQSVRIAGFLALPADDSCTSGYGPPFVDDFGVLIDPPLGTCGSAKPYALFTYDEPRGRWELSRGYGEIAGSEPWVSGSKRLTTDGWKVYKGGVAVFNADLMGVNIGSILGVGGREDGRLMLACTAGLYSVAPGNYQPYQAQDNLGGWLKLADFPTGAAGATMRFNQSCTQASGVNGVWVHAVVITGVFPGEAVSWTVLEQDAPEPNEYSYKQVITTTYSVAQGSDPSYPDRFVGDTSTVTTASKDWSYSRQVGSFWDGDTEVKVYYEAIETYNYSSQAASNIGSGFASYGSPDEGTPTTARASINSREYRFHRYYWGSEELVVADVLKVLDASQQPTVSVSFNLSYMDVYPWSALWETHISFSDPGASYNASDSVLERSVYHLDVVNDVRYVREDTSTQVETRSYSQGSVNEVMDEEYTTWVTASPYGIHGLGGTSPHGFPTVQYANVYTQHAWKEHKLTIGDTVIHESGSGDDGIVVTQVPASNGQFSWQHLIFGGGGSLGNSTYETTVADEAYVIPATVPMLGDDIAFDGEHVFVSTRNKRDQLDNTYSSEAYINYLDGADPVQLYWGDKAPEAENARFRPIRIV